MKFLTRARKELKVGFSSALQVTGIRKVEEDADFIASNARLDPVKQTVTVLLAQLRLFCTMIQRVADASGRVHAKLQASGGPDTQILSLTESLVRQQLANDCIAPLQEFLTRFQLLERLRAKRRRNRQLAASTKGAESDLRKDKYANYHAAFVAGADSLVATGEELLAYVFNFHYYHFVQYQAALARNIETMEGNLAQSSLAQPATPLPSSQTSAYDMPASGFGAAPPGYAPGGLDPYAAWPDDA
jgi:hypothetical protein